MAEKPQAVPGLTAARWVVSGRVQGVGFRYFVLRRANTMGLAGWVSNLPDGRVEVAARGPADAISRLEQALRSGPPMSQVSNVDRSDISDEVDMPKSFEIR